MKKAQELPTQICKASLLLALQKAHPVTQNHAPVGATKGGLGRAAGPHACGGGTAPGTQPPPPRPRAASLALSLCFPWGE